MTINTVADRGESDVAFIISRIRVALILALRPCILHLAWARYGCSSMTHPLCPYIIVSVSFF